MDRRRDGQRNVVIAVLAVMADRETNWKGKAGLARAVAALRAYRDEIDAAQQAQARPLTPITAERRELRWQVAAHMTAMGALLRQIGEATNNAELLQAAVVPAGLRRDGRQSRVLAEAERIETVATPHAAAILAAGDPSDDALGEFRALIKAYRHALEHRRHVVIERGASTALIHARTRSANALLRELDQFMQRLRVSDPEFYWVYRKARQNTERRTATSTMQEADATAPTLEPKAA